MSAEDLGAAIAYIRQVAPVDRELPASTIGPLGRVLFVIGKLPLLPAESIDHGAGPGSAPPPGATPEYGEYLARTSGCLACHGPDLGGGPIKGAPPGYPVPPRIASLGGAGWSEADFVRSMREGRRPDGRPLNDVMPWRAFGRMTDAELRGLWLYLK